jgi:hypothetical protein
MRVHVPIPPFLPRPSHVKRVCFQMDHVSMPSHFFVSLLLLPRIDVVDPDVLVVGVSIENSEVSLVVARALVLLFTMLHVSIQSVPVR